MFDCGIVLESGQIHPLKLAVLPRVGDEIGFYPNPLTYERFNTMRVWKVQHEIKKVDSLLNTMQTVYIHVKLKFASE